MKKTIPFLKYLFLVLVFLAAGGAFFHFFLKTPREQSSPETFQITLNLDGLWFPENAFRGETVQALLDRTGIPFGQSDLLFPQPETKLGPGTTVLLTRSKKYSIEVDGTKQEGETVLHTIEALLAETGISITQDDLVSPHRTRALKEKNDLVVTRVEIREEVVHKEIPFKTEEREDSTLSWRTRTVTQKGAPGIRTLRYRIVSHNSREESRKLLESTLQKETITEIVTQGTKVKVGKKHEGLGSWYRHTGTRAAANPWLPFGSSVRVTNTDTGKSVIVKINDRGPFGKGRIIDLDAVAFEVIAPLGAGIIPVKVEEILN
ncbi:MAG: G5 domain-containing protein [Candidatus Moraniibacteriota bacterium]|nr:MAG: G5 domain-containing protein [Candidatus Moranbacteria bacterium]